MRVSCIIKQECLCLSVRPWTTPSVLGLACQTFNVERFGVPVDVIRCVGGFINTKIQSWFWLAIRRKLLPIRNSAETFAGLIIYLEIIAILSFHLNNPAFIHSKVGGRFHKFLNIIMILIFNPYPLSRGRFVCIGCRLRTASIFVCLTSVCILLY